MGKKQDVYIIINFRVVRYKVDDVRVGKWDYFKIQNIGKINILFECDLVLFLFRVLFLKSVLIKFF